MGMNPTHSTPERILDAARLLFSEQGFERTTIRGIGARAGVDPALVVHYFANKEGIFSKAALSDFEIPDLRQMEGSSVGACLVSYLLDAVEGRDFGKTLIALLRASVSHPSALQALQGILHKRLQGVLAEVVPANEVGMRSGLIATQVIGLAVTRYILKLPSVVDLSKDEVVRRIGPVVQHYLFSYMDDSTRSTVVAG